MSSILRIDASRRNGAKSRGPVTPAGKAASAANSKHSTGPLTPDGKARVSKNALKHGLLSRTVVLPDECPDAFEANLAALRKEFKPKTWSEKRSVEIAAQSDWRRGRAWQVEQIHIARAADAQNASDPPAVRTALGFGNLIESSRLIQNVQRYEIRNGREYLKHLKLLKESKHERNKKIKPAKQSEPNLG